MSDSESEAPMSMRNHRLSSIIEEDDCRSHDSSPNPKSTLGRINDMTPEPDMENPLEAALAAIDSLANDEDFQDVDKENEDTWNTRRSSDEDIRIRNLRNARSNSRESSTQFGMKSPREDKPDKGSVLRSQSGSPDSHQEFELNEEQCEDGNKEDLDQEPTPPPFKERIIMARRSHSPPLKPANLNPLEELPIGPSAYKSNYNIIEPSSNAINDANLLPCPTCSRTFLRPALERHVKICEKVNFKSRNVFNVAKRRSEGNPISPKPACERQPKRKSVKPEDVLKECPHCSRKFGPKPYDRHVQWCEEKSSRLQDSPNKDLVALAKLHARTNYRPRTPAKYKEGSPSRKTSISSTVRTMESPLPGEFEHSGLHRSDSRSSRRSLERKLSNISSIQSTDHIAETQETHFIRAVTGRGSIKRGPAPTKASQLRQLVKQKEQEEHENDCPIYQKNPIPAPTTYDPLKSRASYVPRTSMSQLPSMSQSMYAPPGTPSSIRRQTQSPMSMTNSLYNGMPRTPSTVRRRSASPMRRSTTMSPSSYGFQPVVKPSVVRPMNKESMDIPQRGSYRRDPEGIDSSTDKGQIGTYDHSKQYDPYQSAAKQMQELLFGSPIPPNQGSANSAFDNLRPSTNSAFQKYIPSTADINTKLNGSHKIGVDLKSPIKPLSSTSALFSSVMPIEQNRSNLANVAANGTRSGSKSPKVARFCHECGNPFALPNIRFCCECGVKRLYC
ncbi:uncharacterized protein LOC131879334 [Tigriopus californicus]|uniref:uncharacterized protein LOC131879334 n=1 Tax=Tigriopus californicus TaxID=6832 RepID=UPI0027DA7E32|nr:uncharacterized protein LOC131879334 [Tigriopus californicus]